ncbi:MAG: hypothetical protein BGN91_10295 [Nitrobacter sp. 62-13]|nr:MAG: hypothetical protein BGN91_10295 [Nitrobacter sp. 62-13]
MPRGNALKLRADWNSEAERKQQEFVHILNPVMDGVVPIYCFVNETESRPLPCDEDDGQFGLSQRRGSRQPTALHQ